MYRCIARAALLAASLFGANAGAATLPSNLMLPDPELAARGVVERWVFSIKLESFDLKGIEPLPADIGGAGFFAGVVEDGQFHHAGVAL